MLSSFYQFSTGKTAAWFECQSPPPLAQRWDERGDERCQVLREPEAWTVPPGLGEVVNSALLVPSLAEGMSGVGGGEGTLES